MLVRGYTYKGEIDKELLRSVSNNLVKVYYNSKTSYLVNALEDELSMINNYSISKKQVDSNYFENEIFVVLYNLSESVTKKENDKLKSIDLALDNYFVRKAYTDLDFQAVIDRYLFILNAYHNDCFRILYQGIYSLSEEKIIGYESLLSIISEEGVIHASDFIFELYDLNLSTVICKRVLSKVQENLHKLDGFISINCRINDLLDNKVRTILESFSKEDRKRIILEILEDDDFLESSKYIKEVKYLKSLGYSIAIDDFGSKYANLSYLLLDVFDYLKISGVFNKLIKRDNKLYEAILRSITNLSHLKGLKVLKENASSMEEVKFYKSIGIDYVQGFIFDKPHEIS